jgi:hypothetical protein
MSSKTTVPNFSEVRVLGAITDPSAPLIVEIDAGDASIAFRVSAPQARVLAVKLAAAAVKVESGDHGRAHGYFGKEGLN